MFDLSRIYQQFWAILHQIRFDPEKLLGRFKKDLLGPGKVTWTSVYSQQLIGEGYVLLKAAGTPLYLVRRLSGGQLERFWLKKRHVLLAVPVFEYQVDYAAFQRGHRTYNQRTVSPADLSLDSTVPIARADLPADALVL